MPLNLSTGLHTSSFQSTPSLRKVTDDIEKDWFGNAISIHTFLTEGDIGDCYGVLVVIAISIHTFLAEGDQALASPDENRISNFNPHLPRGR